MGIYGLKENWTKFPNCILDNLKIFTPIELKIMCLMVRKNIGYENPNNQFSIRYIAEKTGISKPSIINAISSLLEKQAIKEIGTGKRGIKLFEINWIEPNKRLVKEIDQSINLTSTGQNSLPVLVKEIDQIKENNKKKTIKENINKKKLVNKKFSFNEKAKYHDFVYLSEEDYNSLTEDFGRSLIDDYISRLDYYMTNNPDKQPEGSKPYLNHKKVIINWLQRANIKKRIRHSEVSGSSKDIVKRSEEIDEGSLSEFRKKVEQCKTE